MHEWSQIHVMIVPTHASNEIRNYGKGAKLTAAK